MRDAASTVAGRDGETIPECLWETGIQAYVAPSFSSSGTTSSREIELSLEADERGLRVSLYEFKAQRFMIRLDCTNCGR